MTKVAWEVVVIFVLVMLNGVFAMSEIAVVSARRARLQQRADAGERGARVALELAESPDRFLATIQIGITLIGIMAGAFGGATLASEIADRLSAFPQLAAYADAIAVTIVVLAITFLTLVLGELVPKQIGLAQADAIATRMARPMDMLARLGSPVVSFISGVTSLVLRLLPIPSETDPSVTEEEVRLMIREGTQEGVFSRGEQMMIDRVLQLNDMTVDMICTPRREVVWIDANEPSSAAVTSVAASQHSHVPVAIDDLDNVVGLVAARDLLSLAVSGERFELADRLRPALFVPGSITAAELLNRFREAGDHVGIVIDEFGGCDGLVTVNDVFGAIVGEFPTDSAEEQPRAVRREDGSWLVDGRLRTDRLSEVLDVADFPPGEGDDYLTVGGLVMVLAGRLPEVGDRLFWHDWCYEVADMDGRRVDMVLMYRPRDAKTT